MQMFWSLNRLYPASSDWCRWRFYQERLTHTLWFLQLDTSPKPNRVFLGSLTGTISCCVLCVWRAAESDQVWTLWEKNSSPAGSDWNLNTSNVWSMELHVTWSALQFVIGMTVFDTADCQAYVNLGSSGSDISCRFQSAHGNLSRYSFKSWFADFNLFCAHWITSVLTYSY